jgi:hypothetical protein
LAVEQVAAEFPLADLLTMPPIGTDSAAETDEQKRQRLAQAMPAAAIPPSSPRDRQLMVNSTIQPIMPPARTMDATPPKLAPNTSTMPPAASANVPRGTLPQGMPPIPVGPQTQRYEDLSQKGAPQLSGWRKVLDTIGNIFPIGRAVETAIPGTPQNYDARLIQAALRAAKEQGIESSQQAIQGAPAKAALEQRNIESEIRTRGEKDSATLAKMGLKRDQNGEVVADEESPVYKANQAKEQRAADTEKNLAAFRQSQIDLNQARTEVENAKNDPNSPAFKQAQQKLAMAQEAHTVAAQNLGLHQAEFANKLQEQDLIKPSGQSQSRGSAAQAVLDLIPDLKTLVNKHRADMGPLMGRINRGEIAIGNVDPEIARLYAAMKSFYALQPAVHGFRNAEFVKDFESALGTLERDPDAFIAGMEGLKPTLESVAKEGKTFHKRIVEGGGGNAPARPKGVPEGAVFDEKTRHWKMP